MVEKADYLELFDLLTSKSHRRHFAENRHLYQNPELPVGEVKKPALLGYRNCIRIDGQYYHYLAHAYENGNNVFSNLDGMSELEFSEPDEEDDISFEKLSIKKEVTSDDEDKKRKTHRKHKDLSSEKVKIKKESTHDEEDGKRKTHKKQKDVDTSRNIKKEKREEHKRRSSKSKPDYDSEGEPLPSCSYKKSSKSKKDYDSEGEPLPSCSYKKSSKSKYEYSSDEDQSSNQSSSKKKEPPAPVQIKTEPLEPPQHLYGHYHCDVCNITMNSLLTFNTHVNGKRHLKNLKAKNVPDVVAKTIPSSATEDDASKYPRIPKGVTRIPLHEKSKIQDVIESHVSKACVGLHLVTEIQGLADTQYYCKMCDAVCSPNCIVPHLTGFKHQMKSVKHFKPETYESIKDQPKHVLEQRIKNILRDIQQREGLGKMAVERDILITEPRDMFVASSHSGPSTSKHNHGKSSSTHVLDLPFEEKFNRTAIPDMSHSDYYCRLCQSHMNSEAMWQNHISGKRHLANLKKMPGTQPSKTRTIAVPGANAYLLERLEMEGVHEPVVGLSQIQEIQIPETRAETYQCFLCGACLSSLDIIEHLLSMKHRQKYLEHIDYPERHILKGIREQAAFHLVEQMCADIEHEEGRGKPSVHVTKSTLCQ